MTFTFKIFLFFFVTLLCYLQFFNTFFFCRSYRLILELGGLREELASMVGAGVWKCGIVWKEHCDMAEGGLQIHLETRQLASGRSPCKFTLGFSEALGWKLGKRWGALIIGLSLFGHSGKYG